MLYKATTCIIIVSFLFSFASIIFNLNSIELIVSYIYCFIILYLLFSIWFSIRLNTIPILIPIKIPVIKIKGGKYYIRIAEIFMWGILIDTIAEIFDIVLWQYLLLLISLSFIAYRLTLKIPIKRRYRFTILLISFIFLYFSGYLNNAVLRDFDEYLEFIEDVIHGIK